MENPVQVENPFFGGPFNPFLGSPCKCLSWANAAARCSGGIDRLCVAFACKFGKLAAMWAMTLRGFPLQPQTKPQDLIQPSCTADKNLWRTQEIVAWLAAEAKVVTKWLHMKEILKLDSLDVCCLPTTWCNTGFRQTFSSQSSQKSVIYIEHNFTLDPFPGKSSYCLLKFEKPAVPIK